MQKWKCGWILQTSFCRKPFFLKLFWKQLVQPDVDYCSQIMPLTAFKFRTIIEKLHEQNYLNKESGLLGKDKILPYAITPRFGRPCIVPALTKCSDKVETLQENSFQWRGPELFACLTACQNLKHDKLFNWWVQTSIRWLSVQNTRWTQRYWI